MKGGGGVGKQYLWKINGWELYQQRRALKDVGRTHIPWPAERYKVRLLVPRLVITWDRAEIRAQCISLSLPVPGGCHPSEVGGDRGLVTPMTSMKTRSEFGDWGSVGWNLSTQHVGTFLKCLNLIQMRQVWGGFFFFWIQLGHGPLPVRPAWLTAARQQTGPESHTLPPRSEMLLQSSGVPSLSWSGSFSGKRSYGAGRVDLGSAGQPGARQGCVRSALLPSHPQDARGSSCPKK